MQLAAQLSIEILKVGRECKVITHECIFSNALSYCVSDLINWVKVPNWFGVIFLPDGIDIIRERDCHCAM